MSIPECLPIGSEGLCKVAYDLVTRREGKFCETNPIARSDALGPTLYSGLEEYADPKTASYLHHCRPLLLHGLLGSADALAFSPRFGTW